MVVVQTLWILETLAPGIVSQFTWLESGHSFIPGQVEVMQLGTAQTSILAVLVCWPAHTPHTEHPDLPSGALSLEQWDLREGGWLAVGATAAPPQGVVFGQGGWHALYPCIDVG